MASDLIGSLRRIAAAEGGPTFMGWPDRWWESHTWRCLNDHVSTSVLRSEELGRDACLAGTCRAPLLLTFPEDRDGPLAAPEEMLCPNGGDGCVDLPECRGDGFHDPVEERNDG